MKTKFKKVFGSGKPLIGMIHLPASPGYPSHPGTAGVIAEAVHNLRTLEEAGFHGALVENDNDQPHEIGVNDRVKTAFAEVMRALIREARIPVGMEIIYDMDATIAVAHAVGAPFVRLDVFADAVETKWGIIPASAEAVSASMKNLDADLLILTDVQVKHARMLVERSLTESVTDSIAKGADGVIVTGDRTGEAPTMEDCATAKHAALGAPVLVGSGLTAENAGAFFAIIDGAIVGTSIKTGPSVDLAKARRLADAVRRV